MFSWCKSQKPPVELSAKFVPISSQNPDTVPPKRDRNVEKSHARTLPVSATKGRAPGPMLNEEEPITGIPDGSFIPLNFDPPGSEVSTYLFLSFFSIIPSRCVVASGCDLALFCLLEIPNAVHRHQPRVSLVVAVIKPGAVEPLIFLLTMTSQDTTIMSKNTVTSPIITMSSSTSKRLTA